MPEHNEFGEVSFNKYVILVSAEASADVTERSGPLVLRGRSPSTFMEAHDLMALAPAVAEGALDPGGDPAGEHAAAGHARDTVPEGMPPPRAAGPCRPITRASRCCPA